MYSKKWLKNTALTFLKHHENSQLGTRHQFAPIDLWQLPAYVEENVVFEFQLKSKRAGTRHE